MGLLNWFKSQMFGGKILRTVGTVSGKGKSLVNSELKVHLLENKSNLHEEMVGLELVQKTILSYQMTPITLSAQETSPSSPK
ncbi:MAG: hypothetical protein CVU78_06190 [Elusimicrobia bacterium HGW-Elusimicrobia-2]|nr:MAG: hypothetical protein CVU78_06190 [Elusimicrobia bacterium HGW-Elusimicrobia-2]